MKKIFLSMPIQGVRPNENLYKIIIDIIKNQSMHVLNSDEITTPPDNNEIDNISPQKVYEHDVKLMKECDILVAELSNPSLGVGYEIALAESMGTPIIYLYNENNQQKVSLMLLGSSYQNRINVSYNHENDLIKKLTKILENVKNKVNNESILTHFNEKSNSYDNDVNWRKDDFILNWFKQSLNGSKLCLDIGTGTGLVGEALKSNNSIVFGLDLSKEMLLKAQDRLDAVIIGDTNELPFLDNQFDGIALRQVLHYVENEVESLREIYRVLKPNGSFACAQVSSELEEVSNWWTEIKSIVQPLRRRTYNNDKLQEVILQSNFKIHDLKTYRIKREDDLETFLINTESDKLKEKAINYLKNTSTTVKKNINLKLNNNNISYVQEWCLLLCKKI